MRTDLLFRGTLAIGDSRIASVAKGHLNGLLFFISLPHSGDTVTIKRLTDKQTHVLAAGVKLADLASISDIDYGYGPGLGRHVEALMDQLIEDNADTGFDLTKKATIEQLHGEIGSGIFYVDLGSIYLNSNSEIQVSITHAGTPVLGGSATPARIQCYTLSRQRVPDFMYVYDETTEFDDVHRKVDSIFYRTAESNWLFKVNEADGTFTTNDDLSIQIEDSQGGIVTDLIGMMAQTAVFGQMGSYYIPGFYQLYRKPDVIPEEVRVKMTRAAGVFTPGTDRLIVRRVVYESSQVSANTLQEAEKLTTRLATLERVDPDASKAMRHAGLIDKSENMQAAVTSAKEAAAAKAGS